MIDFRYHLVSIVSVFLALAVGIVLGAGPLKEDIGNTLTSEVRNLRADKAALRSELDTADRGITARDEFTVASNRSLLSGRLADRTVAVVVLPGADSGVVRSTTATLTSAGATIGSTTTVQDAWVDPDKATFRATLGQQLAGQVGVPVDATEGSVVDAVLARAVLAKAGAPATGAAAALEGLKTGELVDFAPDDVTRATLAVVIAGPVTGSAPAEREDRANALASLAAALDDGGSGALLVAPTATAAGDATSVVAAVRADGDVAEVVSTVDCAETPMGQAGVVFGLLEQAAGGVGHYGLAEDATAAFPELATK